MSALDGQGWWMASRAAGLVALALVTISVAAGLLMAGRLARRPGLPRILMALHEHAAVAGLVAIAAHGVLLLGDGWLRPAVGDLVVPFSLSYRPVWTGLGIVAAELAAILGLSFHLRRRIGPKRWRVAHRATILVYVLSVAHTLGAGTDASAPWLRIAVLATATPIAWLFVARVAQARGSVPIRNGLRAAADGDG